MVSTIKISGTDLRRIIFLLLLAISYPIVSPSQSFYDNHSIRLSMENDFFSARGDGTDRYYTNGTRIDYFFTRQKAKFPSSLLIRISDDNNIYSVGLAQYMFTPLRIDVPDIQYNDRPYAGALFAIHSLNSIDYDNRVRISSEFFIGAMGPSSLAKETQTWIHGIINSTIPQGWGNQVPNDLILNYNIRIDKEVISSADKILVTGVIETFNGTFYNAISTGFMLRIGKFDNYFRINSPSEEEQKRKLKVFVSMQPSVRVVFSNALLQGGIITKITDNHEGYTLNKDQIERVNVFYDMGLTFELPKFRISILQKLRTTDFKGGNAMEVGNITLGIKL